MPLLMPDTDEIDAIGRARSAQADSGSQEREQGLLQLLYEMDGMKIDDKVCVKALAWRGPVFW